MLISAMHEGVGLLQDPSSLASRCKQKIGQSWPHCWQGLETLVSILNGPILLINLNIYIYTSITAQDGGGSFKKRKTIREIGCCESRMSKQRH